MNNDIIKQMVQWHLSTNHKGKANGITVERLCIRVGVSARDIRQAVTDLRDDGVAVAALPSSGYYLAQTPEEIEECCQYLRKRSLHGLRLESRLRKIALPELLGQLSLEMTEPANTHPTNPITQFINQKATA